MAESSDVPSRFAEGTPARGGSARSARVWVVVHRLLILLSVTTTLALAAVWFVASEVGACQRTAKQGLQAAHEFADLLLGAGSAAPAGGRDPDRRASELRQLSRTLQRRLDGIAGWLLPKQSHAAMADVLATWKQVEAAGWEGDRAAAAGQRRRLQRALETHVHSWLHMAVVLTGSEWSAHRLPAYAGIVVCLFMVGTAFSATLESRCRARGMVCLLEGMVEQVRQGQVFGPDAHALDGLGTAGIAKAIPGVSETFCLLVRSLRGRYQAMTQMLDALSPGVAVLSADWRIQAVNESFCRLLDVAKPSVLGSELEQVLPEAASAWRPAVTNNAAGHSIAMVRDPNSGRLYRSRLSEVPAGEGDETGFVLLLEDPQDLSHAAGGEEMRRLYETVMEGISEALLIIDRQGTVTGVNSLASDLLGYSRTELAGMALQRLEQDAADATQSRLETYLSSPAFKMDNSALKTTLRRKDGSAFSAELRFRQLRAEDNGGYLVSLRDVTQDELAELLSGDRLRVIELIARNQPLELVLSNVTNLIEHQMPGSCCTVLLVRGEQLVPVAGPKLPARLRRCLRDLTIEAAVGSGISSFFEGKTVTVADLASWPGGGLHSAALEAGLRSYMTAAIFSSEGRVVGMIAVYRPQPTEPSMAQSDLLQLACRLASVCIEQSQLNGQLAYRAQHDALTGLLNRPSFEERLRQAIAQAGRRQRLISVLSLDLDRFKLVNDTLGHAAGDDLIRQLARRLAACLRDTDVLARWGGDEFVIGLLDVRDRQDAACVAGKLLEALRKPFAVADRQVRVGVSIGLSVFPQDGTDVTTLLRRADVAMYRAKRSGRNSYHCYDSELGEADQRRLELETELQGALERGELMFHYQPLVDLRSGALAGLEALMRWRSPRFGMVLPSCFIPIAEETGLVVPIGTHAVREACRQIKAFEQRGCGRICISVNVSSVQFARPDFVDLVEDAIREAGIEPGCLDLELTESTLMDVAEGSASGMVRLRDLGVRISVDDFGVGYSSLGYLQRLPIDTLKIDRSFISELGVSAKTPLLVESIVSLARSLGLKTTAEGVETVRQLHALEDAGCDVAQGFLLGRPRPARYLMPRLLSQPEAAKWRFRSGAATLSLPSRPPNSGQPQTALAAAPLRMAAGKLRVI